MREERVDLSSALKGRKRLKIHSPVRERWTGPEDANNNVPALG